MSRSILHSHPGHLRPGLIEAQRGIPAGLWGLGPIRDIYAPASLKLGEAPVLSTPLRATRDIYAPASLKPNDCFLKRDRHGAIRDIYAPASLKLIPLLKFPHTPKHAIRDIYAPASLKLAQ